MEVPHARQHPHHVSTDPPYPPVLQIAVPCHTASTRTPAVGQVVAWGLVEQAECTLTWGTAHTGLLCYTRQW